MKEYPIREPTRVGDRSDEAKIVLKRQSSLKRFPKSAMVGLLILSWGLLVVFGAPRWAPPSLAFPAYWGDKDTPGTEGDQVSHLVVYCYGLSITYTPDDEPFWPIVNAAYQAAEDWHVPWEVVAAVDGDGGFQVSPGNAREFGVAVDLVYSRPLRPQSGFLNEIFENDTTQLTFVSEGYVFPHHEDIPLWWNPYWVLTLGHADVLNRVLAENGCK